MARVVDITDKLTLEGNPALKIKGSRIEVNADAPTMLKVMALMSGEDPGAKEISEAYELMFPETAKKELEKLKISFADLVVVIKEAIGLIADVGETGGES